MFQKLSELENSMCDVLKNINLSSSTPAAPNPHSNESIALHQCLRNGYIDGIAEMTDMDGYYHFDFLENANVNQDGLNFLKEKSLRTRFKKAAFDILKGTAGFFLGILSTVTAEIILWMIIQKLQNP